MSSDDLKDLHRKIKAVRTVNAANEPLRELLHSTARGTGRPLDCDLTWHRDGAGWVLLCKRRRIGRVLPDKQHRGMYQSVLSRGRLSTISAQSRNISASSSMCIKTKIWK